MGTRSALPLTAVVGVLALENILSNEVVPDALYVPANLATAGAVAWLAGRDGVTASAAGLDRLSAPRGLSAGTKLAAVVAVGLGAALVVPWARPLLEDERVAGLSPWGLAYQAGIRVPFGTVVLEEVAFRGVLPAMFAARTSPLRAGIASQALFGLWHIAPTLSALEANGWVGSWQARTGVVAGAVVATAVGGGFLLWLRRRTGSLLAPAIVHAAANSLGTVAAWVALRARA